LSITTSNTTPTGTFTLTITGNGGGTSHSQTVILNVGQVGGNCVTASGGHGWVNTPFANQTGMFTVQFDVIPSTATIHGHVGISNGSQTAYTGFANIVRFNATSTIDARNGANYMADTTLSYVANMTYHVRMAINLGTHHYSIFVTPPEGSEVTIGSNYAFRVEQVGVSNLNNYGAFVAATSGTFQVCNFTVQ
jgi:unsaturated chondroitin disaccharide hydrolase